MNDFNSLQAIADLIYRYAVRVNNMRNGTVR